VIFLDKEFNYHAQIHLIFMSSAAHNFALLDPTSLPLGKLAIDVWIIRNQDVILTQLYKDTLQKRASFIQTCFNLNQEFSFSNEEIKLKMLRLYNTALYGSNNWKFSSEPVLKLSRSWNVNLRILFDLPHDTHCWIVEELSDGRHLRQMIFSRFIKYLKTIARNKRPAIQCLYRIIKDDVRSLTGSNIRTVMLESQTDPRSLKTHALRDWRVYPKEDEWTAPLLRNLLEIRAGNWEVIYDDETGESAEDDDINFMIAAICSQ
jgi:hypothetical protein